MTAAATLVVTNGDAAIPAIREAWPGAAPTVVPWRDVLHEGPVPRGDAAEVRHARAAFLAAAYGAEPDRVLAELAARDAALAAARDLVLCFEHDLYDQLQLIDILARVAAHRDPAVRTRLAQLDDYVSHVPRARLTEALARADDVGPEPLAVAEAAWRAFTAADPAALPAFATADHRSLPFLGPALRRLLLERPGTDGLGCTERRVLEALTHGPRSPGDLYTAVHQRVENPVWLGDTSFAGYLERLSHASVPLLRTEQGEAVQAPRGSGAAEGFWRHSRLVLTDAGRAVAEGRVSQATLNGYDRWMGGCRLTTPVAA